MGAKLIGLAAIAVMLLGGRAAVQQRAAPDALPPLQYTCPHHADHVQDTPGSCPMQMGTEPGDICRMALVPVRIEPDFWYTCPLHTNVPGVLRQQPGLCPIDRREKMPVTVTVHWTCRQNPYEKLLDPGRCADGTPRAAVREVRAHGDHNPRHGGTLFMASDQWHHLEGTYPQKGLFRVYFYDNFTQPIEAKGLQARVVLREEFDPATKTTKELEVLPLRPGPVKNALDAALTGDTLPLKLTVKVRFTPNAREHRSDFTFTEYSKDSGSAPRSPQ